MSTPDIYYLIPIINGYVVVPDDQNIRPNYVTIDTAMTVAASEMIVATIVRMGPGGAEEHEQSIITNSDTVRVRGTSYFLKIPGDARDFYRALRDVV